MSTSASISKADGLSKKFGLAVDPTYFDNIEKHKYPDSRQKLDANSAIILSEYLESARKGLLVPQIVHQSSIILWLIDEMGECWFCIEEMYKGNASNTVFPRLNEIDYPKGYEKLGHPSLISADKARIGGEIIWTKGGDSKPPRWLLSNKSGRYGIREDIKKKNLLNACCLFKSCGFLLEPYFIKYEP